AFASTRSTKRSSAYASASRRTTRSARPRRATSCASRRAAPTARPSAGRSRRSSPARARPAPPRRGPPRSRRCSRRPRALRRSSRPSAKRRKSERRPRKGSDRPLHPRPLCRQHRSERAARAELHEDRLARAGGALMASGLRLRKGDEVVVIAGKDRGKRGRVQEVHPRERTVIVAGVNISKRHTKPNPTKNQKGGIV